MARLGYVLLSVFLCGLVAASWAEIVKVTTPETTIYDGQKWIPLKIEGKRFMVFGHREGWYLVEMTINKEKKYVWMPAKDVVVDWGKTKTAEVAAVQNVNTLKLADGSWVQFRGILVPMDGPLTAKTQASLAQWLVGKKVTLEFDKTAENERGYDEAYVYVGGTFVNRALVEKGLAKVPFSSTKGRYDRVFAHFAEKAQVAGLGIWAKEKPTEEPETVKVEKKPGPKPTERERQYVRHLSHAQKQQWAFNLKTEIKVVSRRTKTKVSVLGPDQMWHDGIVPAG